MGDVRAGGRMHRDALSARYVADHFVAPDRVAALGPVDQQAVLTLYGDRRLAPAQDFLDHGSDGRGFGLFFGQRRDIREERGENLPGCYLSESHLRVEV